LRKYIESYRIKSVEGEQLGVVSIIMRELLISWRMDSEKPLIATIKF